jgi:hypothetical protein
VSIKEYHKITFSNWPNLLKALEVCRSPQFKGKQLNYGIIYDIRRWYARDFNRDDLTYNELKAMKTVSLIRCDVHNFDTWDGLEAAIKRIGHSSDVFGILEIELR